MVSWMTETPWDKSVESLSTVQGWFSTVQHSEIFRFGRVLGTVVVFHKLGEAFISILDIIVKGFTWDVVVVTVERQ